MPWSQVHISLVSESLLNKYLIFNQVSPSRMKQRIFSGKVFQTVIYFLLACCWKLRLQRARSKARGQKDSLISKLNAAFIWHCTPFEMSVHYLLDEIISSTLMFNVKHMNCPGKWGWIQTPLPDRNLIATYQYFSPFGVNSLQKMLFKG